MARVRKSVLELIQNHPTQEVRLSEATIRVKPVIDIINRVVKGWSLEIDGKVMANEFETAQEAISWAKYLWSKT
ncbi:MAG: hypothetical protein OQJ97_06915 [Rhodospirillales bacterium]|nr:hypothetical protein [Rhodospirillales bacterium]